MFSQMFRDGFFKLQGEWCAANHLEYQVHLNHEEMEMQLTRSRRRVLARHAVCRRCRGSIRSGTRSGRIRSPIFRGWLRRRRMCTGIRGRLRRALPLTGRSRMSTMARYILNEQFVRGVNLVETMYFPASSTPGRSGPAYMEDPAYPALLSYVRRMSYLLSMGRPAASVALYLPSSSMWLGDAAADTAFVSTERMLSERQIDFDIVSEDALASGFEGRARELLRQ